MSDCTHPVNEVDHITYHGDVTVCGRCGTVLAGLLRDRLAHLINVEGCQAPDYSLSAADAILGNHALIAEMAGVALPMPGSDPAEKTKASPHTTPENMWFAGYEYMVDASRVDQSPRDRAESGQTAMLLFGSAQTRALVQIAGHLGELVEHYRPTELIAGTVEQAGVPTLTDDDLDRVHAQAIASAKKHAPFRENKEAMDAYSDGYENALHAAQRLINKEG